MGCRPGLVVLAAEELLETGRANGGTLVDQVAVRFGDDRGELPFNI